MCSRRFGRRTSATLAAAFLTLAALGAGAAEPIGDPRVGEQLFTGARRLANGGAPCLGCHGVAGHGLARAASFGPDLTPASASEAEGIGDLLESMPFPSMEPVYRGHALTPAERRHLVAFLSEVSGRDRAPRLGGAYWLAVAAVAAAFGVATSLVGGRRRSRSRTA